MRGDGGNSDGACDGDDGEMVEAVFVVMVVIKLMVGGMIVILIVVVKVVLMLVKVAVVSCTSLCFQYKLRKNTAKDAIGRCRTLLLADCILKGTNLLQDKARSR